MTKTQNITVLGAGIMGLTTAYALQKAGHNITMRDPKGFPADNASAMAGGMLAPYSEIEHMNMAWVHAGLAGIAFWRNINLQTGFTQNGSLLIACPEDRYILERFKAHLPKALSPHKNAGEIEPALDKKFKNDTSCIFLKDEAHLSPALTMQALCADLQQQENVMLTTRNPSPETRNLTIDCRGMDAGDTNLRGVKGEIAIVRNREFSLSRPVRLMHPRYPLYIVPRENHIFMIGATVIESSENRGVSLRSSMELMSALYALSPSFADAEILEIKAGIRPAYPDNLPRITINDKIIGANGLFRHGYLLAPVMAQCIADHIAGKQNEFMSLFTKGSNDENHNQRAA
ncbi:MAG: FAD-dependent oxidoreductase [Alphaproteobacteria bacterium]